MMRDRRPALSWPFALSLSAALVVATSTGCISLNYDEPSASAAPARTEAAAWPSSAPDTAADAPADATHADNTDYAEHAEHATVADTPDAAAERKRRRETPTRARLEQRKVDDAASEPARSWRELSRLAREKVQDGELEAANELLAQAASQLADRRPTNTQRRTVFGLRARLAQDLAAQGKTEAADALADRLFEEARDNPALGDAALVALARATAARRHADAVEAGRTDDSQLPLLALAFDTAQSGTATRERLGLGFEVSGLALRAGELDLARRAIDQCVLDAQVIAPGDRVQAAALKVYKARIALAQRDLGTAEATAHAALKTFEEIDANGSNRGVAETTLAQVLAEKGELERGLELARTAYARLSNDEKLVVHARRQIAAGLARVERLAGDANAAGVHYREALTDPSDGSTLDDDLIRDIKAALADLETRTSAAAPTATPPTAAPSAELSTPSAASESAPAP